MTHRSDGSRTSGSSSPSRVSHENTLEGQTSRRDSPNSSLRSSTNGQVAGSTSTSLHSTGSGGTLTRVTSVNFPAVPVHSGLRRISSSGSTGSPGRVSASTLQTQRAPPPPTNILEDVEEEIIVASMSTSGTVFIPKQHQSGQNPFEAPATTSSIPEPRGSASQTPGPHRHRNSSISWVGHTQTMRSERSEMIPHRADLIDNSRLETGEKVPMNARDVPAKDSPRLLPIREVQKMGMVLLILLVCVGVWHSATTRAWLEAVGIDFLKFTSTENHPCFLRRDTTARVDFTEEDVDGYVKSFQSLVQRVVAETEFATEALTFCPDGCATQLSSVGSMFSITPSAFWIYGDESFQTFMNFGSLTLETSVEQWGASISTNSQASSRWVCRGVNGVFLAVSGKTTVSGKSFLASFSVQTLWEEGGLPPAAVLCVSNSSTTVNLIAGVSASNPVTLNELVEVSGETLAIEIETESFDPFQAELRLEGRGTLPSYDHADKVDKFFLFEVVCLLLGIVCVAVVMLQGKKLRSVETDTYLTLAVAKEVCVAGENLETVNPEEIDRINPTSRWGFQSETTARLYGLLHFTVRRLAMYKTYLPKSIFIPAVMDDDEGVDLEEYADVLNQTYVKTTPTPGASPQATCAANTAGAGGEVESPDGDGSEKGLNSTWNSLISGKASPPGPLGFQAFGSPTSVPMSPRSDHHSASGGGPSNPNATPEGSLMNPGGSLRSRNNLRPSFSLIGGFEKSDVDLSNFTLYRKRISCVVCKFNVDLNVSSPSVSTVAKLARLFHEQAEASANQFDGVVYKRELNHIVLVWNAFAPYPFHEVRACHAAQHLMANLHKIEEHSEVMGLKPKWAVVVNTGGAIVGTCGTKRHSSPVALGDSIGFAEKVADLSPQIEAGVVIMEATHSIARQQVLCVPIDMVGSDQMRITLFEMKGVAGSAFGVRMKMYVEAFSLFCQCSFQSAVAKLNRCPQEGHARRLMRFCQFYTASPDLQKYWRASPSWVLHEIDAAQIELPEERIIEAGNMSPAGKSGIGAVMSASRRKSRRPSFLPELVLRNQLENIASNRVQSPGVSPAKHGSTLFVQSSNSLGSPEDPGNGKDFSHNSAFKPFGFSDSAVVNSGSGSGWVKSSDSAKNSVSSSGSIASPIPTPLSPSQSKKPPRPSLLTPTLLTEELRVTDSSAISQRGVSPNPSAQENTKEAFTDVNGTRWMISEKVLGTGSFGTVQMGMAEDGSLVALKFLPLPQDLFQNAGELAPDEKPNFAKQVEDVLGEVAMLSKLHNENIVDYYSSAVMDDALVVIMEYISGGSLTRLIQQFGGLRTSTIRCYCRDVLRGLKYLHSKNVIHRDINPNNVLVHTDGSCKLSDFGASSTLQKLVGVVDVYGTPAFMAPEACIGKAVAASDVWGFGVMVCQMYSGQLPFQPADLDNVERLIHRIALEENFKPLVPYHLIQDEAALSMIEDCLQRDPQRRPTVDQLLVCPFII